MLTKVLIGIICWLIGIFGWVQVIGGLQNLGTRKGLSFIIALWILILCATAALVIIKFNGFLPLIIGYLISLIQVIILRKRQNND